MEIRKPTPKSQKDIGKSLTKPTYLNPEDNQNLHQESQTGINFERSEKISARGETAKDFTIGLEDIDTAVFYYFENVIQPSVQQNGHRVKVPIVYASPEVWKSSRRDAYYRDKNSKIMLPIIVIQRNSVTKDRSGLNKLDANMPNLYGSFQSSFSKHDSYSNFNVLNNKKPNKKIHAVVIPDYVTIEYSITIQTYYNSQLNKIVEACEYASDAYWGDPERFKFKASLDTITTKTELVEGTDRVSKGTFNVKLKGHIIPNTIQKELTAIKSYNTKSKVVITSETD